MQLFPLLSWEAVEMAEVIIEKLDKDNEKLKNLGVFSWPIWVKEISTFDWHYDVNEICYILEGKVRVEPKDGQPVEFGPGDLVTFPEGMDCVWKISEPVRKHYKLG
jgi:uncharacterized cupin superfamily protein